MDSLQNQNDGLPEDLFHRGSPAALKTGSWILANKLAPGFDFFGRLMQGVLVSRINWNVFRSGCVQATLPSPLSGPQPLGAHLHFPGGSRGQKHDISIRDTLKSHKLLLVFLFFYRA